MGNNSSPLILNVLLTKVCNLRCSFCVEATIEKVHDAMTYLDFTETINRLIQQGLVSDVMLLGGEPLYWPYIRELSQNILMEPIITTNGHPIVQMPSLLDKLRFKAINISLPHYNEAKRGELMGDSYSNDALRASIRRNCGNIGINTVLVDSYIDSDYEISQMAQFCAWLGVKRLKVTELTAKNMKIHDFIRPEVLSFNARHYVPLPDPRIYDLCHKQGGTHWWRREFGVDVFANAPPDAAMAGGRNEQGQYYHRVLFNDGLLAYSWRRRDMEMCYDGMV